MRSLRGFGLKLGNGYIIERPLQLVCDLEIRSQGTAVKLKTNVPAFKSVIARDVPKETTMLRKAESTARSKITGIAMHEEDDEAEQKKMNILWS